MTRIIDLSTTDTLAAGDQLVIFSTAAGDTRRVPVSQLQVFLAGAATPPAEKVTQYASPTSGMAVTVGAAGAPAGASVFLYLTPVGTLATLGVALPPSGTAVDRQEVLVKCTQVVTALTLTATGLTVDPTAPTTLAAGGHFRVRFDGVNNIWLSV